MSSIAAAVGVFLIAQACPASVDAGHAVGADSAWTHAIPSVQQGTEPERAGVRDRTETEERSSSGIKHRVRRARAPRVDRLELTDLPPLRRCIHAVLGPDPHRAMSSRMRQVVRVHIHFATEHDRTRTGMLTSWSPTTPPLAVE